MTQTKTIPITTTIKSNLWEYVKIQAKSRKLNYNSILEEAIKNHKKEQLRKQIKEGFSDPDRIKEYQKVCAEMARLRPTNLDEL